MKPKPKEIAAIAATTARDFSGIAGAVLIVLGIDQLSRPAAMIGAGVILLAIAVAHGWRNR